MTPAQLYSYEISTLLEAISKYENQEKKSKVLKDKKS